MKITNGEISYLVDGLMELEKMKIPFNIKTSYKLARNKQILSPIIGILDKKKVEIYKKYGTQEKNGDIKVSKEKLDELEQELVELNEIENEIDLVMIGIDEFGEVEIPFDIMEKILKIIE